MATGWRNADGKRYFSGILAECGVVLTALMLIVPAALFGLIVKHRRKDYRMPFLPFLLWRMYFSWDGGRKRDEMENL